MKHGYFNEAAEVAKRIRAAEVLGVNIYCS